MSTNAIPREASIHERVETPGSVWDVAGNAWGTLKRQVFRRLASLKITVTLFALSTFLILAGTLAQTEKNMWEVMGQYFYPFIATIDVRVFFPHSFFPTWPEWLPDLRETGAAFPFPGGALIGLLMFVNLGSAFLSRFSIQARGTRLYAGLAVVAVGALLTWLVIMSGHNTDGLQGVPMFSSDTLWMLFQFGLLALWFAGTALLWKLDENRRIEKWLLIGWQVLLAAVLCYLFYRGESAQLADESMRILWQLMQSSFAGVVLLIGYLLVFKRRGGVVLIHTGVALLMVGQMIVGLYDVESRMTIEEGQTVNFTRDIRSTELAIVDNSDPDEKRVSVIPLSVSGRSSNFLREKKIANDQLPFDVEVVEYIKNARLRKVEPGEKSPVDAGDSQGYVAEPVRASSGADTSGEVDFAAAYVRFTDKKSGQPIGTYLLPQVLAEQNIIEHVPGLDPETGEARTYEVALRFRRDYKPYSMHLIDVRKDDYMGTSTPRNYSSEIRLVDESRGEDRPVKIWMNNPLRYAGETFYQSGYRVDGQLGTEITDLQVVRNSGWMIPYVACMLAVVGMLAHFTLTLMRFIGRLQRESSGGVMMAQLADGPSPAPSKDKGALAGGKKPRPRPAAPAELVPDQVASSRHWNDPGNLTTLAASIAMSLLVITCVGGFLAGRARTPKYEGNEAQLYEAGKLPIMHQGRLKPLDTLARSTLRVVTNNRETFVDTNEQRQPAIRWLMDVISQSDNANKHRVFYIHHDGVLTTLGLERRKSHLYSVEELLPKIQDFEEQVAAIKKLPTEQLNDYQRQLLVLDGRIRAFTMIAASFRPLPFPDFPTEEEFQRDREGTTQRLFQIKQLMEAAPQAEQELLRMEPPLAVPALSGEDTWSPFGPAWNRAYLQREVLKQEVNPATMAWSSIFDAYRRGDGREFNRQVELYQSQLKRERLSELGENERKRVSFESFFNHFRPFLWSSWLYLSVFMLVIGSWLVSISNYRWGRPFNWAAFSLVVLLFAVHTFAIIARIYISGRPPVTNLYSSAVFIGWGCIIFGLAFEVIFRLGVGNMISAVAGFSTLQIADGLAGSGDTFTVLQAVLDTQFWLSTHVVCISLGYVATFVAGFLGLSFVLGCLVAPIPAQVRRVMYSMIYGTVCFAIFFSFWGTVLGGLWADDSWGRFWGWDPKENGALMIVIWNALMLHSRWDGIVRERGFALLAIGGNIITAWSWFGVNELGIGLHSYGFTDGVLFRLGVFALSQLAVIAIGLLIPKRFWWSYAVDKLESPRAAG